MTGYWSIQMVPARTNHVLHLLLTLFTFGLWAPVWFIVALYNSNRMVQHQIWNGAPFQPANRSVYHNPEEGHQ
jgi:hypothetical protein